jgi:hypothetical protein
MLICILLGSRVVTCHAKSSVTRVEALTTIFTNTPNTASSQVDSTGIPEVYLSHGSKEPTVTITIDAVNVASSVAINTNEPDVGGYSTTDKARTADPLSHSPGIAGDDASSKIRTIFFEIVGAFISIATLSVAVLALRRMPKKKQPDLESSPLGPEDHRPSQHAGLQLSQSRVEPVELDAVHTAVEMRHEEPVIRNLNAQAAVQPPGTS